MNLRDIVYERGRHFVLRVAKGYEVYRIETCASRRVGFYGEGIPNVLQRAIADCDRREQAAA